MLSVLTPDWHILPYRGATKTRVACHLPLIVLESCALVVGGERHVWRKGKVVTLDETFELEAWNLGAQPCVVRIFEIWSPYLIEAEHNGRRRADRRLRQI